LRFTRKLGKKVSSLTKRFFLELRYCRKTEKIKSNLTHDAYREHIYPNLNFFIPLITPSFLEKTWDKYDQVSFQNVDGKKIKIVLIWASFMHNFNWNGGLFSSKKLIVNTSRHKIKIHAPQMNFLSTRLKWTET
jgi:hypothetical protein